MTVSANDRRYEYPGNDVATIRNGPKIFNASQLQVYEVDQATQVSTLLTNGVHYTVSQIGLQQSLVTLVTPTPSGKTLLLLRTLPIDQETAIKNQGAFFPEIHEDALDVRAMVDQQLEDNSERSLRFRDTMVGGVNPQLPLPDPLKPLVWSATESGTLENGDPTGTGDMLLRPDLASGADGKGAELVAYVATGVGAFPRDARSKSGERPSVLDYIDPARHVDIASGTDLFDTSAGFNAALAAHPVVEVPAGEYTMTDGVVVPLGHRLLGAGRRKTIIRVPSTFNLAADGVMKYAAGGDAGQISGMTIIFEQPDSAVVGDYTQYPPAIDARGAPRFKLSDMRIALAWRGVDLTGNSGGAVIDDLEVSAFDKHIEINGSLDSVKLNKIHIWPFASVTEGVMTSNQRTVHAASYGLYSGRCDDLHMSDSLIFDVRKGAYFYSPGAGLYTFGTMSNVSFDGDGGLHVIGDARLTVSPSYFSKDSTDGNFFKQTGGVVRIMGARFVGSGVLLTANGGIEITGGTLTLTGCRYERGGQDFTLIHASGSAVLNINGGEVISNAGGGFTKPAINYAGTTTGAVSGLFAPAKGGGSGVLINIATDTGVSVGSIVADGWTITGPATRLNTVISNNVGVEHDKFAGCVSSTGTSNGLPFGWTCARAGVGNYTVSHNLNLNAVRDMAFIPVCEGVAFAQWDVASSTPVQARIRTYDAAGAAVDSAFTFFAHRRR